MKSSPTRRGVSQWSIQRTGGPQYRIVGATERVLVVEDSLSRVQQFKKQVPNARLAATSAAAIEAIRHEQYDLICLDRDLCNQTYGEDVARALVAGRFAGRVICHSENDFGARLIEKILMDGNVRCERVPFSLLGLVREV
jgi:hypothetical protein